MKLEYTPKPTKDNPEDTYLDWLNRLGRGRVTFSVTHEPNEEWEFGTGGTYTLHAQVTPLFKRPSAPFTLLTGDETRIDQSIKLVAEVVFLSRHIWRQS